MDLVLNEVVNQRHQGTEKEACQDLSVLDCTAVVGTQCQTAKRPRQGRNQIRNHEDIMPVMVVGRCDVCPPSAGQGSEDPCPSNHFRKSRVGPCSQNIPKEDQSESRTGSYSDKDLKDRTFGVAITDGR